jgi:hypothetical protein
MHKKNTEKKYLLGKRIFLSKKYIKVLDKQNKIRKIIPVPVITLELIFRLESNRNSSEVEKFFLK